MNILFLSHTAMGGDFVVGSHHLARQLVRQGHQVAHVSAPVSFAHAGLIKSTFIRKKMRRCVAGGEFVDGVLDIVPPALLPWKLAKSASKIKNWIYHPAFYIKAAFKRHGFGTPDLVVMDEPRLVGLCDLFPLSRLIYRPTDLYAHMRGDKSILEVERSIVGSGRFSLLAMSQPIGEHLRSMGAQQIFIMENGVDYDFFSTPQDLPGFISLPAGMKAVYVGSMDDRFSIEHILTAASLNVSINFLMIGPVKNSLSARCEGHPNIIFLGPISYEFLPSVLQRCDVALLPLSNHPSNDGRSPMKIYEYGAAGLPVVATSTPELDARQLPFVRLTKDQNSFSTSISDLLDPTQADQYRLTAKSTSILQCWAEKAKSLIDLPGNASITK